jgi:WD40 repeat protein/serine/threonine protein kinase
MSGQSKCSQCGAPLAADVPGCLCLRCLLAFGLRHEAGAEADERPPAMDEGDSFPGYQILQKIGEGGCGVVYRALQLDPLRREVAVKVIKLGMDTRSVITRFAAERQALALMDHPNIARVYDAGVTGHGRPFFVMELVGGERITDYCDRQQLSVPQRLLLFQQVCRAVQHAHQKGIIHRDLKPSNILIAQTDGKAVPKVIDFGVAKAIGQQRLANQTIYTAFDQFVGTPAYMSPEQAGLTNEDIDTRSDIYSLGVLLYELLAGRPPFEPERLRRAALDEICRIIREEEPALPSARVSLLNRDELTETARRRMLHALRLVGELRGDLDWLVMKALEKDRGRRYATAMAMGDDIERHLQHEPVAARPPSALYRFQKLARRNRLAFGAAVIVLAALVAGLAFSTWMFFREQQARERAELRAYLSDMNLAARMTVARVGGLAGAVKLLESWRRHQPDLRGWEWYYLNGLCHEDLLTIRADSNQLCSVTWSPDGKRLATGGTEGSVKIWDAADGRLLSVWPGHKGDVLAVAWSPDGRHLASAGQDAAVRIWDPKTGQALTLTGHHQAVASLAWISDASRLASCSRDGTIRIWNPVSGASLKTIAVSNQVFAVAWAGDGTRLTAAGAGFFKCWDAASYRLLWSLPSNSEGDTLAVAWSPDGTQLATGNMDNSVGFRDAATGTNLVSFFDNHNKVLSVAWNPNGTLLASATVGDGRIAIRDMVAGGRVIRDFRGHLGSVRCVCWQPNGSKLASASADGTVKLWDAGKDDPATIQFAQPDQGTALAWNPDSTKLAAGSRRMPPWIWEVRHATMASALPGGYTPWTWAVAWNPDGTRLASACTDGIEVWDSMSLVQVQHFGQPVDEYHNLAWSPDARRLAAIGRNGKLKTWDAATGKLFKSVDLPHVICPSLVWSPDGRNLAGAVGRWIYIWDAVNFTQSKILDGHADTIRCLAWSPDSTSLASACDDSTAKIWDVARGSEVSTLLGHATSVYSVAWSPDGKRVVTGSWDFSVKIWDPITGTEVCSFDKPGGITQMIYAVAWSPDGREIACSDIEGNICILDATPGGLGAASLLERSSVAALRGVDRAPSRPVPSDAIARDSSAADPSTPPAPVRKPEYDASMVRSLKLYCEVVEPHATNNADALRRLAWILATSRHAEVRDGSKAVAFAQQASNLVGGRNPGILSILAAACAENGDFTNAISFQKQAMAMVPNIDLRTEYAAELRLYETHQPCRDNFW